jgi:hypothetical protein
MHFRNWLLGLLVLSGCSSPANETNDAGTPSDMGTTTAGDGACPDPADKSDADLTTPQVSFASDIMPIFQMSCGIGGQACHGATSAAQGEGLFLGYFDGGTDPSQVHALLVGVPSQEDPQMNRVTAGQPSKSYLWQKVDNLQCNQVSACAAGGSMYPNCGSSKPYDNPPLDAPTLDKIQRWIAQGANAN